jgi:hypothetical protein
MQKGFATKSDAENILKIPFRKNCQCQFFFANLFDEKRKTLSFMEFIFTQYGSF